MSADNVNSYAGITRQLAIVLRDSSSGYTVEDVRKDWRAYVAYYGVTSWHTWLTASGWLDA